MLDFREGRPMMVDVGPTGQDDELPKEQHPGPAADLARVPLDPIDVVKSKWQWECPKPGKVL